MSTNEISAQIRPTSMNSRRRGFVISGLALRLLLAFILSWLVLLAFFVSGAVSH